MQIFFVWCFTLCTPADKIIINLCAIVKYSLINMRKVKPFLSALLPLNIAHRGGMAVAPENTIHAFTQARYYGSEVFELDLHTTKDGEFVVIHDDTVDRTTNGHGRVKDLTCAEIKRLDAAYYFSPEGSGIFPLRGQGITIPTLWEVFETFPECRLNIEIKEMPPGYAHRLRSLIQACAMEDKVLIAAEQHRYARAFRPLAPQLACSASRREVTIFYLLMVLHADFLYDPPFDALQVPEYYGGLHLVTPRFISWAHKKHIKVHVWTVNEQQDMERLLSWGVDGIVTDCPDRLKQVLHRHRQYKS